MYPLANHIFDDVVKAHEDGTVELLGVERCKIQLYDIEFGRYMTLLTRPASVTHIKNLVHKEPGIPQKCPGAKRIGEVLSHLDPTYLMELKHIFIIQSEQGLIDLCRKHGCDIDMIPEALFDENGDSNLVGVYWHYESAIIINWKNIQDIAENDIITYGIWDQIHEMHIGVYSTIFHELRHIAADSRWFYGTPVDDPSEDGVERWTRFTTDTFIARGII